MLVCRPPTRILESILDLMCLIILPFIILIIAGAAVGADEEHTTDNSGFRMATRNDLGGGGWTSPMVRTVEELN
jgi:hypothetical protein